MTSKEYNDLCNKCSLIPFYDYYNGKDVDDYTDDYVLVDREGYKKCICGYRDNNCSISKCKNKMCLYRDGMAYAWYDTIEEAEDGLLKLIAKIRTIQKEERIKMIEGL